MTTVGDEAGSNLLSNIRHRRAVSASIDHPRSGLNGGSAAVAPASSAITSATSASRPRIRPMPGECRPDQPG